MEGINAELVEQAKQAAGISETVNTWSGWRETGYEVKHGEKCLFQVQLHDEVRGPGKTFKASFFGASQTIPLAA